MRPVAKIALDTRSFGPPYCETCDADVEDVFLMSNGALVCVDCMTPVKGLEAFSEIIAGATGVTGPKDWKPEGRRR